jgi:hypothetical protein
MDDFDFVTAVLGSDAFCITTQFFPSRDFTTDRERSHALVRSALILSG